jgi:hypothetical protein
MEMEMQQSSGCFKDKRTNQQSHVTDKNGRHVAIFFSALFFRFFFGVCRLDNEPEGSVIKNEWA